jgi:putative DNA primase/helicase
LSELEAGGAPRTVADRGTLFRYDPDSGLWREFPPNEFMQRVGQLAGAPVRRGERADPLTVHDRTRRGAHATALSDRAKPAFFDCAPLGVAFADGYLRLDADGRATMHDHSPENRATVALPFARQEDAVCPLWDDACRLWFGLEPDPDRCIAALSEFVGACLFGQATRYERALWLIGEGANGKSQLLAVLGALFEPLGVASIAPHDFASETFCAALASVRANLVTEADERIMTNPARYKAILSGDQLTARRLYKDPFQFRPRAGHIFACNDLPATRDHSRGFWRRALVLRFARDFEGEARHLRRAGFAESIIAAELAGIVAWAERGWRSLADRGEYTEPACHEEVSREWRLSTDSVAAWVEERCGRGGWTATDTLYDLYSHWARGAGLEPVSKNAFGKRLGRLGITAAKHVGRGWELTARGRG